MRTVEEISADVNFFTKRLERLNSIGAIYTATTEVALKEYTDELIHALVAGIPLDRLREICEAERKQRCVVLSPAQQPTTDPSVKPKCFYTESPSQYYCRGYCHGEDDDEPVEACQNCWWCDGNDDFRAEAEAALKEAEHE